MYVRRIVGDSMVPSFYEGDIVVFIPFKTYRANDVVIAEVAGREVIKRIANITGDAVFLAGDNPAASTDSRSYGPLAKTDIKGRLCFCAPFSRITARRR